MHLTVSEMNIIVHFKVFMAYPFIPEYLTCVISNQWYAIKNLAQKLLSKI